MPKHLINITAAAEQDLVQIVDYIANDNPTAALKLAEEIECSILQLEDFPLIGAIPKNRRLTQQGYRVLIVDSYLVFYVPLNNGTVEIRRNISGKRDYNFFIITSMKTFLVCKGETLQDSPKSRVSCMITLIE
ncbi:MAG TPA: type II toxin-antitoxin system mRNA interferase toxin, RelE/StbE family [Desulfotomaculum sp.]|nr:type II toxin-antitoxin system mRNA interferase toxin, RelE/StbE family [Desulfotomaculum sp.]HBY05084.1 type II toxin-antitoxin system mRNA interferase toxin, RelE/StbE family [Desulfotomaculum sp.]